MTSNEDLKKALLAKLNRERLELEKERDVYKMKYLLVLKKTKEDEQLEEKIKLLSEENRNLKALISKKTLNQVKSLHPLNTESIFEAVEIGNLEAVKYWFSVLYRRNNGDEPMHLAAEKNFTHILKYFSENNINIDSQNEFGYTPLHYASFYNSFECVQFLVDQGVNLESVDSGMQTPLHFAASKGNAEMIEYLIKKGANIEAKDRSGNRPLHRSTIEGHVLAVRKLLEMGADIDAQGYEGKTPLHKAYCNKKTEIVNFLIAKGANKNIFDNFRKFPIDYQESS